MGNKERAVNLSWTWYLLLGAIILMATGIAISWGLRNRVTSTPSLIENNLAAAICNVISLILVVAFYYFDSKDIRLLIVHVPKKYIYWYFTAGVMFAITILFSVIYFSLTKPMINSLVDKKWEIAPSVNLVYGLGFGIVALFSLISIGFYRYTRFKIDLTLYRRRHGETTNTPLDETPPMETTDTPLASTGLTDNATKE